MMWWLGSEQGCSLRNDMAAVLSMCVLCVLCCVFCSEASAGVPCRAHLIMTRFLLIVCVGAFYGC